MKWLLQFGLSRQNNRDSTACYCLERSTYKQSLHVLLKPRQASALSLSLSLFSLLFLSILFCFSVAFFLHRMLFLFHLSLSPLRRFRNCYASHLLAVIFLHFSSSAVHFICKSSILPLSKKRHCRTVSNLHVYDKGKN